MNHVITILAFTLTIPLLAGVIYYKRLPQPLRPIVYLLAVYFIAEGYMFALRFHKIPNMHVSYFLTACEIYLFSSLYAQICANQKAISVINSLRWSGVVLVLLDYVVFGNEMNTFSLTIEYILLAAYGVYFYYETLTDQSTDRYSVLNFTLLFYMLSSFPYFFAWEWLRVSDMNWLRLLASTHAYMHATCYLFLTYIIWRFSLRLSAR